MIIAVLCQKGGVGKTTLATNLAAAAHLSGARTLLCDQDEQGSAYEWSLARGDESPLDGLAVVQAERAMSAARYREITRGYGVAVIDGPPRLHDVSRSAAFVSDVVVVPVLAGLWDLRALESTLESLDRADELRSEIGRPPIVRGFVLNRVRPTVMAKQALRELEGIENATVFGSLGDRVIFVEAAAEGASVLTVEPSGQSSLEIRRIFKAIQNTQMKKSSNENKLIAPAV